MVQNRLKTNGIERRLLEIISRASFTNPSVDAMCMDDALSDVGVDSLAFMEVVVCVEEEFGITVADEDLVAERFETIGCLKGYILSQTQVPTRNDPYPKNGQ